MTFYWLFTFLFVIHLLRYWIQFVYSKLELSWWFSLPKTTCERFNWFRFSFFTHQMPWIWWSIAINVQLCELAKCNLLLLKNKVIRHPFDMHLCIRIWNVLHKCPAIESSMSHIMFVCSLCRQIQTEWITFIDLFEIFDDFWTGTIVGR